MTITKNVQCSYSDAYVISYLIQFVYRNNRFVFPVFFFITLVSSVLMSSFPFFFPSKSDIFAIHIYAMVLAAGLLTSKIALYFSTYLDNKVYKNLSIHLFSLSIINSKEINDMDRAHLLNINEQVAESASVLVNSLFSRILPFLLQVSLVVLFAVYNISLSIGILLAVSSILQCVLSIWASKKLRKIQEQIVSTNAEAYANASDIFQASKTLSSLKIFDIFIKVFKKKRENYESEVNKYIFVRLWHDIAQVSVMTIILFLSFYFSDFEIAKIITINFIVLFILQGFDSIGINIIELMDSITKFKASHFSNLILRKYTNGDHHVSTEMQSIAKFVPFELEIKKYNNLNFEVKEPIKLSKGSLVVLTGDSGVGKTTLLEAIAGIKSSPNWEMTINGSSDLLKSFLFSFAYHDTDIFINDLYFNISLEIETKKTERINCLISLLNLEGLKESHCHPNMLSSGEKLRIGIARALYQDRGIYLFDEPTVNLDRENRSQVIHILHDLAKEHIVICSTHDRELIERAQVQIIFKDGNIISKNQPNIAHSDYY